jgi:hypothetical protein
MGKTSERLNDYQTQMSIYAEQHNMILASDVLDMIEQLQDDLKDDTEKVVAELEKLNAGGIRMIEDGKYELIRKKEALEVVRKGGVE